MIQTRHQVTKVNGGKVPPKLYIFNQPIFHDSHHHHAPTYHRYTDTKCVSYARDVSFGTYDMQIPFKATQYRLSHSYVDRRGAAEKLRRGRSLRTIDYGGAVLNAGLHEARNKAEA
jgi:hypothetical protein